jgi:hypothetical protein
MYRSSSVALSHRAMLFTFFDKVPYDGESLQFIAETRGTPAARALEQLAPAGAHFRSELAPFPSRLQRNLTRSSARVWGGDRSDVVLLLWEAWHKLLKGRFQHLATPDELSGWQLPTSQFDHELYPDVVLRALSVLVPGLQQYWNGAAGAQLPRPKVDGGYYTRTPENMPLIGEIRARDTRRRV